MTRVSAALLQGLDPDQDPALLEVQAEAPSRRGEVSPLWALPGTRACRGCGRAIWCAPVWKGPPPPDLCLECWREGRGREPDR